MRKEMGLKNKGKNENGRGLGRNKGEVKSEGERQ
jgi:hypothetical protein